MWQYADWITLDDPAARLERLRLHIVEVTQRTMGTSSRGQAVTAVDTNYLKGLREDESKLQSEAGRGRPGMARNKTRIRP